MEIKNVFKDSKTIINFIDSAFVPVQELNKSDKFGSPLEMLHNNRSIKDSTKKYTFLGLQTDLVAAYVPGPDKFCIYIILNFQPKDLCLLEDALGLPENVTKDDFRSGAFSFLHWEEKDFAIYMEKSYVENLSPVNSIIHIRNISADEMYDLRPMQ